MGRHYTISVYENALDRQRSRFTSNRLNLIDHRKVEDKTTEWQNGAEMKEFKTIEKWEDNIYVEEMKKFDGTAPAEYRTFFSVTELDRLSKEDGSIRIWGRSPNFFPRYRCRDHTLCAE